MTHPIETLILQEIQKVIIKEQSSRIKMKGSEVKALVGRIIIDKQKEMAKLESDGLFDKVSKGGKNYGEFWFKKQLEAAGVPERRHAYALRELQRLRTTSKRYKKLVGTGGQGAGIITKIQVKLTPRKQLQVFWMKNNPGKEKIQNTFVRHHYTRINSNDDLAGMFCAALKDLEAKKGITPQEIASVSPNTFFYDTKVRNQSGRPKVTYFRTIDDFIRERAPAAMPCLDGGERESISKPEPKKEPVKVKPSGGGGGGRRGGRCYYGGPVSKQEMFELLTSKYGLSSASCGAEAKKAIRKLQKEVGVKADGKFGPITGRAVCKAGLVKSCAKGKERTESEILRSRCAAYYDVGHPCDKQWCHAKTMGKNFTCKDPDWEPPEGEALPDGAEDKRNYDMEGREYVKKIGSDAWKFCAKKHKPDTDEFGKCYAKARSSGELENQRDWYDPTTWAAPERRRKNRQVKYTPSDKSYDKLGKWDKFKDAVFGAWDWDE